MDVADCIGKDTSEYLWFISERPVQRFNVDHLLLQEYCTKERYEEAALSFYTTYC